MVCLVMMTVYLVLAVSGIVLNMSCALFNVILKTIL